MVDPYLVYRASVEHPDLGFAELADRAAPLLALAQGGLARWFCGCFAIAAVLFPQSIGQNLKLITHTRDR